MNAKEYDNLMARFWSKVDPSNGCWEWQGARNGGGYGQMWKSLKAHRVSWTLFRGKIPGGLCVLHKCDNPPCVNPDHLFLGTHQDNATDRNAKGRKVYERGEKSTSSKVSDEQVQWMIAIYENTDYTQAEVASLYGMTQSWLSSVLLGKIRGREGVMVVT